MDSPSDGFGNISPAPNEASFVGVVYKVNNEAVVHMVRYWEKSMHSSG